MGDLAPGQTQTSIPARSSHSFSHSREHTSFQVSVLLSQGYLSSVLKEQKTTCKHLLIEYMQRCLRVHEDDEMDKTGRTPRGVHWGRSRFCFFSHVEFGCLWTAQGGRTHRNCRPSGAPRSPGGQLSGEPPRAGVLQRRWRS